MFPLFLGDTRFFFNFSCVLFESYMQECPEIQVIFVKVFLCKDVALQNQKICVYLQSQFSSIHTLFGNTMSSHLSNIVFILGHMFQPWWITLAHI